MAGKVSNFASSSPWIPQDDILLKNAVEAGASFEALAKGAVRLSRTFTAPELLERWHLLLYDPDVSIQASGRMLELELSGFDSSSAVGSLDNAKSAGLTRKRKNLSIRRQYNAMRKRLKTELFDSNDGCLLGTSVHDSGSGGNNYMLRDCFSDQFGLQDSDFDLLHRVFPQQAGDIGSSSGVDHPVNVYETQFRNLTDYNHLVTNVREDNIHGFSENIPFMVADDARGSLKSDVGDKVALNSTLYTSTKYPLQELPNDNHFRADSDGSGLLLQASQMPRLPLWKTMEDMPVHMNEGDTAHVIEEASQLPDNYQKRERNASGVNVNSEHLMKNRQNGECHNLETVCSNVSQDEFPELSYSLLNFHNEDEFLFMNVDGKDAMGSASNENVDSLVIISAGDAKESGLCNSEPLKLCSIEPCTTSVSSTCPKIPCSPRGTELKNNISLLHSDVQHSTIHAGKNVASTSNLHSDTSQLNEEVCCVLNTEDTEIPCNDDIFLLIHSTSCSPLRKPFTIASIDPSSLGDEEDIDQGVYMMEKVNDPALSYELSLARGLNKLPESYRGLPLAGGKLKSEVLDPKCPSLQHSDFSKTTRDLSQSRSVATSVTFADGVVEEDVKVEPLISDNLSAYMETALPAEAGSTEIALREIVDDPSASEQDEPENDMPYSSDIEAMILEMELPPHDQDSYTSSRHGLKYGDEDARKKIIRLEQCARSSMQRKMTSHGALAFLYGRRLKHYLKKIEVLLGRSTDDVDVDIDLRKEGRVRANTISRRQAFIKMKTDGSFVIKNLGKSSISVNGKAIPCEQSSCLSSSSLIEIKGMSFVFEINHKYVRRYLDTFIKSTA